jgi:glutamate/tyrosine decarboxylase-like PLP-dependent enzyme
VQRGVALAEEAQRLVEREPSLEVVTPARLGVLTFAVKGANDAAHGRVTEAVNADGYAAITGTVFGGRSVLRLCTINPRTTMADLAGTVSLVVRVAADAVDPVA